ncbi:abortive infection system antitoxin AbiGi family protein [Bacillus infantis]|uniref:Uncharacterized protein n=1 Tax=Bacillus infantis TaxID=324767 RepID=A0A5D4RNV6_9BACI|nr:abortive infection system antitoxin AbiGi family protein [Bacillus infantis]TYS51172.1 hypothetical protein FZD51_03795 [Bacillus infantis]
MVEQSQDVEVINLEENPIINERYSYIPSKQSANVLFKFMGKLKYLKETLLNMAIIPRYYEEKIDYLEIDGIDKIAFPMSCFCDIHLNKLKPHMKNYGDYGIGLSKGWGIQEGIQPIHYINFNSKLKSDFSFALSTSLQSLSKKDREEFEIYNNLILHNLFYMKPIQGKMIFSRNKYDSRNFHDEKEWRFIPDFSGVDTELPMVIEQEQMNPKSYDTYSLGIKSKPDLWLKFDINAIKHIIVNNQSDRKELIDFIIENKIGENDYERYLLFSKILVFNEIGEDW